MPTLTPYCPACGYDLRGSAGSAQCPECGQATDESSLRAIQVPWAQRATLGKTKALLRTAWRVSFRTGRFCQAVSLPLDYTDARRFQLTVVTLLWATTALAAGFVMLSFDFHDGPMAWAATLGWPLSLALGAAFAAGWFAFLLLGTGLHTYWLHPKALSVEQQNRAVALGYYACAPLLWAVPGVGLLLIGLVLVEASDAMRNSALFFVGMSANIVAVFVIAGMAAGFVLVCFQMTGRAAQRGTAGRFSLLLTQPLLLILLACFTVLGLPFVVGYLWLIAITW